MTTKRFKRSTEHSLDFLNNITAPRHIDANTKDPKRRRTTHADVYDIPVSPSPKQSEKSPQSEPRNTGRLSLQNRPIPWLAPPVPLYHVSDSAEVESSNGESEPDHNASEPDSPELVLQHDETDVAEGEEGEAYREESESQAGEVSFLQPVDLFPSDEQDGSLVEEQPSDEDNDESEDGYGDDDDQAASPAGENLEDVPGNESGDEYIDTAEEDNGSPLDYQNNSAFTPTVPRSHTVEVQIVATSQSNRLRISRGPTDVQALQNVPPQPQEVPETPTMQSPGPYQTNHSTGPNIFTWLTEATKGSGFKETWDAIRITRKTLKAHADLSMKERFGDIIKLIERLRGFLEIVTDDPASAPSLKYQCSLIANNIFKETQWILYEEAPEDEEQGAYLVNQLEAHIVPRLIDLVIFGFKTYKTIDDRGLRHFRIVLDLLWGCSDRIYALTQMHYDISVSVWAYSKRTGQQVKVIKDALNDGRLREMSNKTARRPRSYKHFLLEEVNGHIACGRWTSAERAALRDGLRLYEGKPFYIPCYQSFLTESIGEDRYIDIKCDERIGSQLSERILQNIQAQATKLNPERT